MRPVIRLLVGLSLVAVILALLVFQQQLTVSDPESGEVYHRVAVENGEVVRLSWTHSVEKTPWVEVYEVADGGFLLREARVKSFGAGVDQLAPETRLEDGWVILGGTQREFPELRFLHSREVDRRLEVGGEALDLTSLPERASVEVEVARGPVWPAELRRKTL